MKIQCVIIPYVFHVLEMLFLPFNNSGLRATHRLHKQQQQDKSRFYFVNKQDRRQKGGSQQQTKPIDCAGSLKSKNLAGIKDLKNRKADIRQQSWNTMTRRHNRQSVRKQGLKADIAIYCEQMRELGAGVQVRSDDVERWEHSKDNCWTKRKWAFSRVQTF